MTKASKKLKILFYNWIQFDKINNSGGGVNVYQKNLIDYLINNTDCEIYFLSSGIYYNLLKKKPSIIESKNIYKNKCKTYKLINSPCVAPAKAMAHDIDTYLNDTVTYELLKQFIKDCGGFDVIHFNNIEGLSLKCLEIKKDFPETRIVFSIHNYFPFCPQINLFYNSSCNCEDYNKGTKCVECLNSGISKKQCVVYYKIDGICEKLHLYNLSNKIKKITKSLNNKINSRKNKKVDEIVKLDGKKYELFRKENISRINEYVDTCLAVSDRVRDISIKMGIDKNKVFTNYIGTAFGEKTIIKKKIDLKSDKLTIAYMGYFEKMKGFDFLIEALETLPDEIAKKIKFICYAKIKIDEDKQRVEKVLNLNKKLDSSKHFNGYNHSELKDILSNIDLGIVPVIWEDNLPQVAIEYVAHGVPVLCSDLGGAHELSKNKSFIFKSGSIEDFHNKLTKIVNNKQMLEEYFDSVMKLRSMKDHVDELFKYYK